RLRGRDGRPYGPLPRRWAHYKGLYHFGNQVILSYTVGDVEVLEMPGIARAASEPVFTRMLNVGPHGKPMVLQVAKDSAGGSVLRTINAGATPWESAVFISRDKVIVAGISKALRGSEWLAGS